MISRREALRLLVGTALAAGCSSSGDGDPDVLEPRPACDALLPENSDLAWIAVNVVAGCSWGGAFPHQFGYADDLQDFLRSGVISIAISTPANPCDAKCRTTFPTIDLFSPTTGSPVSTLAPDCPVNISVKNAVCGGADTDFAVLLSGESATNFAILWPRSRLMDHRGSVFIPFPINRSEDHSERLQVDSTFTCASDGSAHVDVRAFPSFDGPLLGAPFKMTAINIYGTCPQRDCVFFAGTPPTPALAQFSLCFGPSVPLEWHDKPNTCGN